MRIQSIIILMVLGSCRINNTSTPVNSKIDSWNDRATVLAENTIFNQVEDKNVHTQYGINDSKGRQLLIQNSYPKGGMKYTDTKGQDFNYVIFWTNITNQSDDTLDLNIEFSSDSLALPDSSSTYFKLYLPPEKMTRDKVVLKDFGLENLKQSLDRGFGKPSSQHITILPKASHMLYVVALSNKGVKGVVRAGFSVKEEQVLFTINKIGINCGHFEFKN